MITILQEWINVIQDKTPLGVFFFFFNVSFPSSLLFMIWIQKRLGLSQIGTISKHAEAHIQIHTSMHKQKLDRHQPSSTSLIFPLSRIKNHTQEELFTLPALIHISHYRLCILTRLACFWPHMQLWGMCLITDEGAPVLMQSRENRETRRGAGCYPGGR